VNASLETVGTLCRRALDGMGRSVRRRNSLRGGVGTERIFNLALRVVRGTAGVQKRTAKPTFAVPRATGLLGEQRQGGPRRFNRLRREEFDAAFPRHAGQLVLAEARALTRRRAGREP